MKTHNTLYSSSSAFKAFCESKGIRDSDEILLQIFTGILDKDYIEEAISSIKELLPHISIIGSTTDGEIMDDQVFENSIVLSFTIFEKTKIKIYSTSNKQNSYQTASSLIDQIEDQDMAKVSIVFTDGLNTNGEKFLKSFRDNVPHIVVAGGLAGDNATFTGTFVFTQNGVQDNGAVAAVLYGDDLIVNTSFSFGWEEIGKELTVTKADGNRVYTIDGIGIIDIYKKYLGREIGKQLPAIGIEFPLMLNRNGNRIARAVISKSDDGSLIFAGDIKTGEKVHFGYGNIENILNGRHHLYDKLLQKPIESIFVYSCMARKKLLANEILQETKPLSKVSSVSGFFTYGEFYYCDQNSSTCENYLFNQTMTILTLSENEKTENVSLNSENVIYKSTLNTLNALTHLINTTSNELKYSRNIMEEYIDIVDQNIITSSTDLNGIITYASKAFSDISGYSKEELIGVSHNIIRHPDTPETIFEDLWNTIKSNKTWTGEVKNLKKDGGYYWVAVTISPNFDDEGNKIGYTAIRQDITDKKYIEELSITDGLTNLFNRRHFNDIFPKVIKGAKRLNESVSFCMIDIDFFKQFNDTYGHQMGDDALVKVADTIKSCMQRADDYCFRLGGEEFGMLVKNDPKDKAIKFANRIKEKIKDLHIEHKGISENSFMTVSMGLVCENASEIQSADEMYKAADDLLYEAKKSGRDKVVSN